MKLAEIFSDHMILQREKPVAVFGSGEGRGSVELCGNRVEFAAEGGRFCVWLPAMAAGGPYELTVVLNGETTVLRDVLVGDVYLAAGQSNMALPLWETTDIPRRSHQQVRLFTEPHDADARLQVSHRDGRWRNCRDDGVEDFSAIGYDVACQLHERTGVPIGIISCNKGTSRVDSWTAPEIVNTPDYQRMITPRCTDYDDCRFNHDSWLYRHKLLPIVPYTLRGVLWYQGESNRRREEAVHYHELLAQMIGNWRQMWREKLPFYCVQLMPYEGELLREVDFAAVRQAQVLACGQIPQTYLITLVDTDEALRIHPMRKHQVACMLAKAVGSTQYGWQEEYSGPVAQSARRCGDEVEITFAHEVGLHFAGAPTDIYIYGADGTPRPAECRIAEDKLFLRCPADTRRVTMGYANQPRHTLYNGAGFWASPFDFTL